MEEEEVMVKGRRRVRKRVRIDFGVRVISKVKEHRLTDRDVLFVEVL